MHKRTLALFGLLTMWGSTALAGDFDGDNALICAVMEAGDCIPTMQCVRDQPDEIGAPAFIRLDFETKSIVGPHRNTAMHYMELGERQLLLQGNEIGYGWTLALDRADGSYSASMTNHEGTFLLFGSCIKP